MEPASEQVSSAVSKHLRWSGKTAWCASVSEMQADPDGYLKTHYRNPPHRSRGMEGGSAVSDRQDGDPKYERGTAVRDSLKG